MTTDTKAVARWDIGYVGGLDDEARMISGNEGRYVLFTDHERVVGDLQAARNHDFKLFALADENIASLRTALSASRAEVEELKKDAERYRWLRDTPWKNDCALAPVIEMQMNAIWDKSIDAAMEKGNV